MTKRVWVDIYQRQNKAWWQFWRRRWKWTNAIHMDHAHAAKYYPEGMTTNLFLAGHPVLLYKWRR